MNIHEYQAKEILERYGVPMPKFVVISDSNEAKACPFEEAVVKIQVHAGGRGKAGGVKLARSKDEIEKAAQALLGMKMVNNQTGPAGVVAKQVMISELVDLHKEFYIGATMVRAGACAVLIASAEGGMEIEEIAAKTPEKILKLPIPLDGKLSGSDLDKLASFMGWSGRAAEQGKKIGSAIAQAFMECDGELLEINPLVATKEGKLWAVDAKLSVDDNALFRQKEIAAMFDPSQVSVNEAEAKKYDIAYISLDGEIGCMVNGAGLAMATMDIIKYAGGKPANFLDVGGSATKEIVQEGFKIILSDPHVRAILVNIFGGIMNCATIAEGLISAVNELSISVPLVVRLEGTNVEVGKRLLKESGLKIVSADSLGDAATKVVGQVGDSN